MRYFSVAVTIKTKWFESLKEWFLWNKFIGVEHFYIVDDNSAKPLSKFFKNFSDQITFINDVDIKKEAHQSKIFKKIYNDYKSETHWMAFIDDDEYIMSLQNVEFLDFLRTIEDKKCLELTSRVFGPHGYMTHEGEKQHRNSFILDRYWAYESKRLVKSIVNCTKVEHLDSGGSVHRLVAEGAVDCFGDNIGGFTEETEANNGLWQDKIVNNSGLIHNPKFVINHYTLKSWAEIEYKLKERGFAEGEKLLQSKGEDGLSYRYLKLCRQVFNMTREVNPRHKSDFYFDKYLPKTKDKFKKYFNENIDKFEEL